MSETKSKPFQLDEQPSAEYEGTYTVTVTDGEISSIGVLNTGNNLYQPVNPESDLFTAISKTDDALDTISINTTGETGNVTETVLQDKEQLNQNYTRLKSEYNNRKEDLNETTDNIETVVSQQPENATPKIPDTFRYPFDIDDNQDHLKIQQFEYQRPPSGVQASRPAQFRPYTDGYQADDVKGKPYGKYGGTVLLPMPKVSDSNGAEWGKSDLNVFGLGFTAIAGGIINTLTGNFGKDNEAGFTAGDELRKGFLDDVDTENQKVSQGNLLRQRIFSDDRAGINNFSGIGQAGLAIGAQELSKFAGVNLSADEVLARSTGKILNPNAELLFQGPVLRDFGFKFLMIARSEDEAEEIRKIIKFFKVGAAPVFSDGPALLGTPNVFQLEYKAGKRRLNTVNRFNEMALRTITVDYAPDGFWSAYQDSHPVAVVMSLQFSELRPLYRVDHEFGGEVGY